MAKNNQYETAPTRPIWSGALNFGLVNIPVHLFSATNPKGLDFDFLHKKDFSPIRFARVCKLEEKEIPYEQIVRGFEYRKDEYVVLTEEDFQKANVKKTNAINILDFVNESEIESIYFERPYYLEPGKGAQRPYVLLLEALKKTKKVGIANYVIRHREHLGAVKAQNNIIILNQLRFPNEIRKIGNFDLPKEELTQKEIEMAKSLINQLTETFHPEKYKDTYTEELKKLIEEKAHGLTPKPKGQFPKPTPVSDLMATLRASLEKEKTRQPIRSP
ncbi:Ku protein [Candidatus Microgenomates bacterium]|nr:MAG: Ku protein [Candidatus Microgenomates bacterium]